MHISLPVKWCPCRCSSQRGKHISRLSRYLYLQYSTRLVPINQESSKSTKLPRLPALSSLPRQRIIWWIHAATPAQLTSDACNACLFPAIQRFVRYTSVWVCEIALPDMLHRLISSSIEVVKSHLACARIGKSFDCNPDNPIAVFFIGLSRTYLLYHNFLTFIKKDELLPEFKKASWWKLVSIEYFSIFTQTFAKPWATNQYSTFADGSQFYSNRTILSSWHCNVYFSKLFSKLCRRAKVASFTALSYSNCSITLECLILIADRFPMR